MSKCTHPRFRLGLGQIILRSTSDQLIPASMPEERPWVTGREGVGARSGDAWILSWGRECVGDFECNGLWVLKKSIFFTTAKIWGMENV